MTTPWTANDKITAARGVLKSDEWEAWRTSVTDQKRGVPHPPLEQPVPPDAPLVDLVAPGDFAVGRMSLIDAIRLRVSHRTFADKPLTGEELSFLLWATQGVRELVQEGRVSRRTVPSGGSRHPFETYLCIERVQGLGPGLYRYLPLEHKLCLLRTEPALYQKVNDATNNQNYGGAVIFIWTTIPYRTEWRYSHLSPKLIALDAGHLCQNLYLACTAIGAGTCALDAYDQEKMDRLLGVDGQDEFAIYCAPVGKVG
jgi:SagB-type dehydrogenase family enzyme